MIFNTSRPRTSHAFGFSRRRTRLIASIVGAALATCLHGQVSFQGLGNMGRTDMDFRIRGISDDGSIIVGNAVPDWRTYENVRPFMWTRETGLTFLPHAPGAMTLANGVSGNGSVVVGADNLNLSQSARWLAGGPIEVLGSVTPEHSGLLGACADGSVMLGYSQDALGSSRTFVTAGAVATYVSLSGAPPGPKRYSIYGTDISDDGRSVVGYWRYEDPETYPPVIYNQNAFLWTAEGGMEQIGHPTGLYSTFANGISGDGKVIVGSAHFVDETQAFRWSREEGRVTLSGASYSRATSTNHDGSLIVGTATLGLGVFVWDKTHGIRSLSDLLIDAGIDLSAWSNLTFEDIRISADGNTIAGNGWNRSTGMSEAWIVSNFHSLNSLAAVPEPTTYGLLASSFIALLIAFRRGKARL